MTTGIAGAFFTFRLFGNLLIWAHPAFPGFLCSTLEANVEVEAPIEYHATATEWTSARKPTHIGLRNCSAQMARNFSTGNFAA